jgi:hypothetical protein
MAGHSVAARQGRVEIWIFSIRSSVSASVRDTIYHTSEDRDTASISYR